MFLRYDLHNAQIAGAYEAAANICLISENALRLSYYGTDDVRHMIANGIKKDIKKLTPNSAINSMDNMIEAAVLIERKRCADIADNHTGDNIISKAIFEK